MTVSPLTPNADRPADESYLESMGGHDAETRGPGGDAAGFGPTAAPWEAEDAAEDEHLQQYMAQFLKTHNIGGTTGAERHTEPQSPPKTPDSSDTKASPVADGTVTPVVEPGQERDAAKPTKAPESTEDLRQWRQLANTNLRQAIKLHAYRQSVWMMRVYLTLGLVSTICSLGLVLAASNARSSAYALAAATWVIAAVACLLYLRLVRQNGCTSSLFGRSG